MAQLPGDRWLDPASEDLNMTKAMTLGKGRRGSSTGCIHSSWMVQPRSPAAAIANQQGHAINHHVSRVSAQLAQLPRELGQGKEPAARRHLEGFAVPLSQEKSSPACVSASAIFSFLEL